MGEPHIKGLSSPQEKRMVSPSPSKKDLKPRTHERIGLRAYETKGKKEKAPCQDQKIKGNPVGRTGLGYPEAARGSGFSGRVAQLG